VSNCLDELRFVWTTRYSHELHGDHTWDSGAPKQDLNLIKACSVIPSQKDDWRGLEGIVKDPIPLRSCLGTKEFSTIHMYCKGFRGNNSFFQSNPYENIFIQTNLNSLQFQPSQTSPYTVTHTIFTSNPIIFLVFNCWNSASEPDHMVTLMHLVNSSSIRAFCDGTIEVSLVQPGPES